VFKIAASHREATQNRALEGEGEAAREGGKEGEDKMRKAMQRAMS